MFAGLDVGVLQQITITPLKPKYVKKLIKIV